MTCVVMQWLYDKNIFDKKPPHVSDVVACTVPCSPRDGALLSLFTFYTGDLRHHTDYCQILTIRLPLDIHPSLVLFVSCDRSSIFFFCCYSVHLSYPYVCFQVHLWFPSWFMYVTLYVFWHLSVCLVELLWQLDFPVGDQ